VLLSANTGLYGDIIQKTFISFQNDVETNKDIDIAIVGQTGKHLCEQFHLTKQYAYFELPDQGTNAQLYTQLLSHILSYEHVFIYHGLFKSIVTQEPITTKLDEPQEAAQATTPLVTSKWLVDPSLEKILSFFESELLSNVFHYSLDESQLAKLASRISALENATENIQKSF
jgi:F0F1-type ATP synthase gamma subunit